MSYDVALHRPSGILPVGSPLISAFKEQDSWLTRRGYYETTDYVLGFDQDQTKIEVTWKFYNKEIALLFKLTWGGK